MAQLTEFEKAGRILADGGFQSRVKGAMIRAALDIKGEVFTTVEDTALGKTVVSEQSRKRASLADQVIQSPNTLLERFTTVLSVFPGIITKYATTITAEPGTEDFEKVIAEQVAAATREISDADISNTIAGVWDDLAGVNGWDSK